MGTSMFTDQTIQMCGVQASIPRPASAAAAAMEAKCTKPLYMPARPSPAGAQLAQLYTATLLPGFVDAARRVRQHGGADHLPHVGAPAAIVPIKRSN